MLSPQPRRRASMERETRCISWLGVLLALAAVVAAAEGVQPTYV